MWDSCIAHHMTHLYGITMRKALQKQFHSQFWNNLRLLQTINYCNKEATEPRVPFGKVEVITSKILRSPPWLGWLLWNICVTNDHRYVPLVVNTSRSFPHSRLTTGFVTRLTQQVPLVEQELLTLPEHLSSPPVFSGVRVTRSLVLYVCFVDRCLSFCTFSFGHCVVCSSSIYGFNPWFSSFLVSSNPLSRKSW
jgi:hypothetical protein